ncbi:MAG TPA: protein kinase [Steroidobacteraceae bacterium]|jgi:serine/threonine protein kinase|nr:protein kinase [Steroidobacteraceae bacterium]
MNKESALANLGLQGSEDTATVARVYGERLSVVQDQLIRAQSDAERGDCQTKLSQLVESYELVTQTGRYTKAANDSSATVMRTGTEIAAAAPQGDTAIRMEPGAVLSSRLEIGALLGQGGMGNVYAARDRLKDEDVAIKVLRQDLLFSTAAKERFLAEAKVSCNLSHPNIVRVYDVGLSGSYYYFSMERLKGHNLRHRIEAYEREKREFSIEEVTDIARQLIDALRYAHRYIVHRDIKPENIWIADDGTVKLMDFGIARAYSSVHMTQTGMTLGTAYYMAPEQRIAAKDVDWRADQYSLGVVLYELLAGTLPTGAVKPLETVRRDLPKRYARALMRAMSPKPEDRFSALADLLAEMDGPERKVAVGIGGLLLIAAGVAAAGAGAYFFIKPAAAPTQVAATEPAKEPAVEKESMPKEPAVTTATTGQSVADSMPPPPTQSDTPPPKEPPSGDSSSKNAAALVGSDSAGSSSTTQVAADAAEKPVRTSSPTRVAAANPVSQIDARRQECVTQCERDSGECKSLNRRGKQDCMRAVAFGGSGRLQNTNNLNVSCAFYGQARCDRAYDRDACLARMTSRHNECVQLVGNIASRRQDCEDKARESDKMCLDELRDCRAGC